MKTILSVAMMIIASVATAQAQDFRSVSTPYGQEAGSHAKPREMRTKDAGAPTVNYNGRLISLSESNTSRDGYASKRLSMFSLGGGSTLNRTTLQATAVGNSVSISGTFTNSNITINQRNNGNQNAYVYARR